VAEDTRAKLVELFQLFGLTPEEAAIAARGDANNPANGARSNADLLADISEPIGRSGF
jgi:hypothetical protein